MEEKEEREKKKKKSKGVTAEAEMKMDYSWDTIQRLTSDRRGWRSFVAARQLLVS